MVRLDTKEYLSNLKNWWVLVFPAGLSRPGKSRDVPGRDHPGTGLRDFFGPGTF